MKHTSNSAVKYAYNCSTEFTSLFDLVQGLYNYFTATAKRNHALREKFEALEFGLPIKNLADTRWVNKDSFYL